MNEPPGRVCPLRYRYGNAQLRRYPVRRHHTRISPIPSPHPSLCGVMVRDIHLDALAVPFDADRWEREFLASWPPESPAYRSYFSRIDHGPDYMLEQVYTAIPGQDAAPAIL